MMSKARKYRLTPSGTLTAGAAPSSHAAPPLPNGAQSYTAQQLRQARRNAQRHNISAANDLDAITQMQARGIDPFVGTDIIEKAQETNLPAPAAPQAVGPMRRPDESGLPQNMAPNDAVLQAAKARNNDIDAIRHGIAKRRRRKLLLLYTRLVFFVLLPTAVAAWYFFFAATPMYATKSEFMIEHPANSNAGGGGGAGGLAGMLTGGGSNTMQDAVTVQAWLTSRAAMLKLDEEHSFRAHFSAENIDPLQRLAPDATNEDLYALYEKHVKVGYDPTDGIIKMEVIAADSASSQIFATALLSYAEQQIDQLTVRLRSDQMTGAQSNYEDAEKRRSEALEKLLAIQVEAQQLDSAGEISARTQQLSSLEAERQRLELDLRTRSAVARPNEAQLNDLRSRITNLDAMMTELRANMTQTDGDGGVSLATKNTELRIAEENYTFQANLVQQSLMQLEAARIQADRQARYITVGVEPIAPDKATYPRAFENTILAFFVFAGLYLMLSITAAILREQVSS